ncbi:MAG: hypothetical protein ACTHNH_22690 [Mesorhizobium sp.]
MTQSLKALWTFALAAALVALPLKPPTDGAYVAAAFAKNGSNGGGNSQGGNNGNGNSQDASGNPRGGNENSQGKGKSKGSGNKGTTSTSSTSTSSNPVTGDKVTVSPYAIELLHRNGMSERISGGRYQMRDAQRRIIVDRPATERDRRRLSMAIN